MKLVGEGPTGAALERWMEAFATLRACTEVGRFKMIEREDEWWINSMEESDACEGRKEKKRMKPQLLNCENGGPLMKVTSTYQPLI